MRCFKQPSSSRGIVLWMSKMVAIFLVVLFMCSNTVLAANWVYLQRQEGTRYGPCTEYIDADSVIKEENKVTYWTIWVFDEKSDHHNIMKMLRKKETILSAQPQQHRILKQYFFDAENEEIQHYLEPVKDYGKLTDEVKRALGYAKFGTAIAIPRPDHVVTPTSRWYGFLAYDDCNLYWDIHSIVVWPQDKPTVIDIRVKQVWDEKGVERRKAFLATQKPYSLNKENDVSSTVLSYQLLINQPKLRILEVTDYDGEDHRITLLDGVDWKEIEPGSMDDAIRSVALNWIKDRDGIDGKSEL